MSRDSYIIAKGQSGHERLKKLTEATWKFSEPFFLKAGVQKAKKILDAGCGNGLIPQEVGKLVSSDTQIFGFDYDKEIIEIAKKLNKQKNIQFISFNISENELPYTEKFDFIYTRYLLSHVKNPDEVLDRLLKKLQPNGVLYVEDVDYTGHFSYPFSSAFNRYVVLYQELALILGANPLIGKQLFNMLYDRKLINIQMNSTNNGFSTGVGKEIALITLKKIFPALIQHNIISERDLNIIVADLENFTKNERTIISFPRIFHAWATNH